MSKRTTVQFRSDTEISSVVDAWASGNGYRLKNTNGSERTYQKGTGFLVAPMMLKVREDNLETTLEAWVRVNILMRLMGLFIIPSEMGIGSGGFRLCLPRSIARKAVNVLLHQLGQPAIS